MLTRARAMAVAGPDARMNGCEMPVPAIGSHNEGGQQSLSFDNLVNCDIRLGYDQLTAHRFLSTSGELQCQQPLRHPPVP